MQFGLSFPDSCTQPPRAATPSRSRAPSSLIDSRNPSLVGDGPGESACAQVLAQTLERWGFRVEVRELAPGRSNVIARIGREGGPALLFNGHLDTVGVEGMIHAPWDAEVRDGRIYGRGSSDMKAGISAMCAAALRVADAKIDGEVIIAAVADEEYESIGTRALIDSGLRADAAIVTEPTRLAICPAHRGFAWLELVVHGRAAHGSRYDIGIDAITLAAHVLGELDEYQRNELAKRMHPLLGRPSLHASVISGGLGLSTYPDRCSVQIERRTLPGESAADFAREVEDACERVRARTRRPLQRGDHSGFRPGAERGRRGRTGSCARCRARSNAPVQTRADRRTSVLDRRRAAHRGGHSRDLFWSRRHRASALGRGVCGDGGDRARDRCARRDS